ncbi:MAG: hypothetical protein LBS00_08015 [Synergistaceae bacterium]|jgi:hypothetical protein|nr:hypothetical protein [Synergistaceae bacterium]
MAINEIAKTALESAPQAVERGPSKFEAPETRGVTEKSSTRPELFDAQEIRDKVGDVPADTEETKETRLEKNSEPLREIEEGKEAAEQAPIKNKVDGLRREGEVRNELEGKYPSQEGYSVESEVYLRDKDGNKVRDPVTNEARRVDFVVVKDGKVVDSVEVTSKTADKTGQAAKEARIRENGGNFIKDSNGNLVEIPRDVTTRIERKD